jgi:hypothetical protein
MWQKVFIKVLNFFSECSWVIPSEKVQNLATTGTENVNSALSELRRLFLVNKYRKHLQSNSVKTNFTGPRNSVRYNRENVITVNVYVVIIWDQKSGVIIISYNRDRYNRVRYWSFLV